MTEEKRHQQLCAPAAWWTRYLPALLAAIFVLVFTWLPARQLAAFQMPGLDLAENDQAIWNTLRGRFLYSTIHHFTILAQHFSPFMAVLSPLFWIWSDIRMLFLAQAAGLAVAGLFLYQIVRVRHPAVAPWFLLAFYLNPALHKVALAEFRRVTIAVPFLALAMYALYVKKRGLMTFALACAILCKEDVAVVVAMVGVYLVLFERDWAWGAPIAIIGTAWAVLVTFWVIPTFFPQGEGPAMYPQLNYLGIEGNSQQEVFDSVLRNPLQVLLRVFDRDAMQALWRVFLPVGLVLPLLAPQWLLLCVPSMLLMLATDAPGMHRLERWYMAPVLPGLLAAVAVALTRLRSRSASWATAGLLCTTLLGYALYSHAPLGARYAGHLYRVTDRHRLAAEAVAAVPAGASVAAQDPYLPHLSHRDEIYLYPWIPVGVENVDWFVLDRHMNPYPMSPDQVNRHIDERIADPRFAIAWEADGIYVFHQGKGSPVTFPVDRTVDGSMRLDRADIAAADVQGVFHPVSEQPVQLRPGQGVRVSLYWEALASPGAERTVSVRIVDRSGALVAVYDNLPGMGKKPTSWWEKGWQIRDVYYLTVPANAQGGPASLRALVYDSHSQQVLPFDNGAERVEIASLEIVAE